MGERKIRFCDNCNDIIDDEIYFKATIYRMDNKKGNGKILDGEFCPKCFWDILNNKKKDYDTLKKMEDKTKNENIETWKTI